MTVGTTWVGNTEPADDTPLFAISAAAKLAGVHAQTLRQYDRLGLVSPSRTTGGGRRYSMHDLRVLREVQQLSRDGVSLAGIERILELQDEVTQLRSRVDELQEARSAGRYRVFTVAPGGQVTAGRLGQRVGPSRSGGALVVWGTHR